MYHYAQFNCFDTFSMALRPLSVDNHITTIAIDRGHLTAGELVARAWFVLDSPALTQPQTHSQLATIAASHRANQAKPSRFSIDNSSSSLFAAPIPGLTAAGPTLVPTARPGRRPRPIPILGWQDRPVVRRASDNPLVSEHSNRWETTQPRSVGTATADTTVRRLQHQRSAPVSHPSSMRPPLATSTGLEPRFQGLRDTASPARSGRDSIPSLSVVSDDESEGETARVSEVTHSVGFNHRVDRRGRAPLSPLSDRMHEVVQRPSISRIAAPVLGSEESERRTVRLVHPDAFSSASRPDVHANHRTGTIPRLHVPPLNAADASLDGVTPVGAPFTAWTAEDDEMRGSAQATPMQRSEERTDNDDASASSGVSDSMLHLKVNEQMGVAENTTSTVLCTEAPQDNVQPNTISPNTPGRFLPTLDTDGTDLHQLSGNLHQEPSHAGTDRVDRRPTLMPGALQNAARHRGRIRGWTAGSQTAAYGMPPPFGVSAESTGPMAPPVPSPLQPLGAMAARSAPPGPPSPTPRPIVPLWSSTPDLWTESEESAEADGGDGDGDAGTGGGGDSDAPLVTINSAVTLSSPAVKLKVPSCQASERMQQRPSDDHVIDGGQSASPVRVRRSLNPMTSASQGYADSTDHSYHTTMISLQSGRSETRPTAALDRSATHAATMFASVSSLLSLHPNRGPGTIHCPNSWWPTMPVRSPHLSLPHPLALPKHDGSQSSTILRPTTARPPVSLRLLPMTVWVNREHPVHAGGQSQARPPEGTSLANRHLRRLDFTGCSPVLLLNIALAAPQLLAQLHELVLVGMCDLDDTVLGAALSRCKALRMLNLRYCHGISSAVLHEQAHNLKQLISLDLTGCFAVQDAGLEAVLRAATQLEQLHIRGCGGLTAAAMRSVAQLAPALRSFSVAGIPQVDLTHILQLLCSCARLETLHAELITFVLRGSRGGTNTPLATPTGPPAGPRTWRDGDRDRQTAGSLPPWQPLQLLGDAHDMTGTRQIRVLLPPSAFAAGRPTTHHIITSVRAAAVTIATKFGPSSPEFGRLMQANCVSPQLVERLALRASRRLDRSSGGGNGGRRNGGMTWSVAATTGLRGLQAAAGSVA